MITFGFIVFFMYYPILAVIVGVVGGGIALWVSWSARHIVRRVHEVWDEDQ